MTAYVLLSGYSIILGAALGVVLAKPWKCASLCCLFPEEKKRRGCDKCAFPVLGSDGTCPACGQVTIGRNGRTDAEMREYMSRSWNDGDAAENIGTNNVCSDCHGIFFGHKRRELCKKCTRVI